MRSAIASRRIGGGAGYIRGAKDDGDGASVDEDVVEVDGSSSVITEDEVEVEVEVEDEVEDDEEVETDELVEVDDGVVSI